MNEAVTTVETNAGTNLHVVLSDAAARRISAIVAKSGDADRLRISVEGGGCSGFSYRFDLTKGEDVDDLVIENHGAMIVIDAVSLTFLQGAVVDFVDDLMGQSFQIRNPNAVASCGCGTSFSV